MMNNRVGDGWTLVHKKNRKMKSLKEKKEIGEGRFFQRRKDKNEFMNKESIEEEGIFKSRSSRSDSKTENFQESPFFSLRCSGPIPVSGIPVVAGVFDDAPRDLPAAVLCTSGTALPKVKLKPEVMVAGTQVEQEERVTGDTPPARLGCAVPVLETDFSRASRVKFDSLSVGASSQLRTKLASGRTAGVLRGPAGVSGRSSMSCSAGVPGRRLLRSLRRHQALIPAASSQVDDMFESNFVPHQRVISRGLDFDSLHSVGSSVFSSSSSPSLSCVSCSCGACVGGRGAGCGGLSEHVGDRVASEDNPSGFNSWKHGHESAGGTKALNQCSGSTDRLSFVDTALGGAALEQYLRGAPKGTKVEAWEGRIFTCSRPTSWDVSVAEGCKVTVSAVYLPKKRPGPPAAGPLYRILFGWSRLLYTASSGIWIFRGALRGSQVLPALASCFDWAVRGTYRTAWAVQPCCRCSYTYGNGPAVGPQVSGNWEFLRGLWKAVAPLMAPWCADGEMPTCANLNLYEGSGSRVRWHSDNEGLFGRRGESKLIVSMSFGVSALFKWKPGPSLDSDASESWLHHGDLLVMDGCCQDEYLHCTDPLQGGKRVNITFRWIRNHVPRCPLAAGVVCCLPTCAKGSFVYPNTEVSLPGILSVVLLVLLGWDGGFSF